MRIPSDSKKGYPIAAKIAEILRFLKAERIVSVIGGRIVEGPNGKSLIIDQAKPKAAASSGRCAFGTMLSQVDGETTTFSIVGGVIAAGPQSYNVANYEIDTSSDGEFAIWISVDVVANMEDGLILPGIESSSEPTWGFDTAYPDQTIPTISSSGEGTAIVPLGSIVITDGLPIFYPVNCGAVAITHCPGTLSATRYLGGD